MPDRPVRGITAKSGSAILTEMVALRAPAEIAIMQNFYTALGDARRPVTTHEELRRFDLHVLLLTRDRSWKRYSFHYDEMSAPSFPIYRRDFPDLYKGLMSSCSRIPSPLSLEASTSSNAAIAQPPSRSHLYDDGEGHTACRSGAGF